MSPFSHVLCAGGVLADAMLANQVPAGVRASNASKATAAQHMLALCGLQPVSTQVRAVQQMLGMLAGSIGRGRICCFLHELAADLLSTDAVWPIEISSEQRHLHDRTNN